MWHTLACRLRCALVPILLLFLISCQSATVEKLPTPAPTPTPVEPLRYFLLSHRAAKTVKEGGREAREGYQFAIVDVAVENVAPFTHDLNVLVPDEATLVDSEGYSRVAATPLAWIDVYTPLPSRSRARLTLVFEVPAAIPYAGTLKIGHTSIDLHQATSDIAFPAEPDVLATFPKWPYEFEFPEDRKVAVSKFCLTRKYDQFHMLLEMENLYGYDQNLADSVYYSYIDAEGRFCNKYYGPMGEQIAPRTATTLWLYPAGEALGSPDCGSGGRPPGGHLLLTVVVWGRKEGVYDIQSFAVDMDTLPPCQTE